MREVERIAGGNGLDDHGLHPPERGTGGLQNIDALSVGQARECIVAQHPIEVGDDLVEKSACAGGHTLIQPGATDIQTSKRCEFRPGQERIPASSTKVPEHR